MGAEQLGWYYFDGQLRYKDGLGWTERYKSIDGPGVTTLPARGQLTDVANEPTSPDMKAPAGTTSHLVTAVCAALLGIGIGVGGGLVKPDVIHAGVTWASDQVGQVSALFSPQAPSAHVPLGDANAKVKSKLTPQRP